MLSDIQQQINALLSDTQRLYVLNLLERYSRRLWQAHYSTQRRLAENRVIAAADASGEPVGVVWSGMDCDCNQYSGNIHLVRSAPGLTLRQAVDKDIEHTYAWADGPCGYFLARLADLSGIKETSRDLVLEAFEDGHPYYISGAKHESC